MKQQQQQQQQQRQQQQLQHRTKGFVKEVCSIARLESKVFRLERLKAIGLSVVGTRGGGSEVYSLSLHICICSKS